MPAKKYAGVKHHRNDADARRSDQLGGKVDFLATPSRKRLQAIRAELTGDERCAALGIAVRGYTPVLDLCRALIAADLDPKTPLYCYRGETLCLTVRSIGEAAALEINGRGTGFKKCRSAVGIASPVRPDVPGHHPPCGLLDLIVATEGEPT